MKLANSFCIFLFSCGRLLCRYRKCSVVLIGLAIAGSVLVSIRRQNSARISNYFMKAEQILKSSHVISTPTCKILNITWDPGLEPFLTPRWIPPDCSRRSYRWTYTDGSAVVLNKTSIREAGYDPDDLNCCYQTITRVEQDIGNYNENCDTTISISSQCIPLHNEVTELDVEFIQVECTSKYWPFFLDVVYRNYHALAQPGKTAVMRAKSSKWATAEHELPPNVIMIGIDSLSRMNFRRTMKATAEYLTEIGAVELLGYTKVGENTFANAVPFLGGYSEQEFRTYCFGRLGAQDSCPYIWKRFNSSNYFTAHIENAPRMSAFNSRTKTFVKQQVDFYLRPFMISFYNGWEIIDCIGPDSVEEKTLRYVGRLLKMSQEHRIPLFLYNWITNRGHSDFNVPLFVDETYANFLKGLNLTNTILFFMSDHGIRFGGVRETERGWLEDKLPNFWLYLPESVRRRRPEWIENLRINRKRLASTYDTYRTLEHILDEFTNSTSPSLPIRRRYGQSLFRVIPLERTCEQARIGSAYCPCDAPHRISVDSEEVREAVATALNHLNREKLPPQCARFMLREITAGATTNSGRQNRPSWYYTVTFAVDPGGFKFEAVVKYERATRTYTVAKGILRMNEMSRSVDCVSDQELQRLCYCL